MLVEFSVAAVIRNEVQRARSLASQIVFHTRKKHASNAEALAVRVYSQQLEKSVALVPIACNQAFSSAQGARRALQSHIDLEHR